MSKEQVIDYVMTTPGNPNKMVLNGMLDSLANGSGGISVPVPTVEDAGKSIVVNDEGKYALANAGGGSTEPLIVRMTKSGSITFLDHTWQEISDASMAWLEYEAETEGVVATVKVTLFGVVDTGEVDNPSRYQVVFDDFNSQRSFATNAPNGYPQADTE